MAIGIGDGSISPDDSFSPGPSPSAEIFKRMARAQRAIDRKAFDLSGAAGEKLRPDIVDLGGGFTQTFQFGTIYYNEDVAEEAFFINKVANKRYRALGGPRRSFLGWPVSSDIFDEIELESGVTRFQHGAIYWWPDIGAIEMRPVTIRYVGLHCFGETDEVSGSDEPYAIFGVVPVAGPPPEPSMTQIYEEVDGGEVRFDNKEIWRGLPFGGSILISMMEHDHGDREAFKDEVEKAVDKTGEKVAEGLATIPIPVVGTLLSIAASVTLIIAGDDIAKEISHLFGTEDDFIAISTIVLSPKEMMRLSRVAPTDMDGIFANLASPILTDGDASYKVYFTIEVAP